MVRIGILNWFKLAVLKRIEPNGPNCNETLFNSCFSIGAKKPRKSARKSFLREVSPDKFTPKLNASRLHLAKTFYSKFNRVFACLRHPRFPLA